MSGGVASNQYLREKLESLCQDHSFTLHTPPPHLCTDNGIMIAWSALEHLKWASHSATPEPSVSPSWQQPQPQAKDCNLKQQFEPLQLMYHGSEMDSLDFRPRWPLGTDISEDVKRLKIKLPKSKYFKRSDCDTHS